MTLRYPWQTTPQRIGSGPGARELLTRWLEAIGEVCFGTFSWRLTPGAGHITSTSQTQVSEPPSSSAPPDAVHGNLHDFEAFFHEHERAIFTYLYRVTGNEQTAYDLSQETFVRAWQRYERIRDYERPLSWLLRVATNLALNERRKRVSPAHSVVALDAENDPATSDHTWRLAERDLIREVLLALPPRQRAAMVLREVYGLSGEEVAAALGVSHAAAKMLLSRAREQFRQRYSATEERR